LEKKKSYPETNQKLKERLMEIAEIFCQRIISTGTAFGIRTDTGEQTFIPAAVVKASNLQEGDTAQASLAPNKHETSNTPWFVVRIHSDNPKPITLMSGLTAIPPEPKTLDERAFDTIKSIRDGYLATAEVAADLGTDTTIAHNALLRLFNQGKIAKADVYASGGQSRPSFCLWARTAKDFVGEEIKEIKEQGQ
jgi:hypothetical protein